MSWLSRLFGRSERYVELEGDGQFECEVVGESKYQLALEHITGGKTKDGHAYECTALLEPEPRNPHDRNAITVKIDGALVGYLSRPHAKIMSAAFQRHRLAGGYAAAQIVGGWIDRKSKVPEGSYGVRLDIPV